MLEVWVCADSKSFDTGSITVVGMCELKAEGYVRGLMSTIHTHLLHIQTPPNHYWPYVNTRVSMAESQGLPEQYRDMSLEKIHGEIRRMEQLLHVLKERAAGSEPRTSCSSAPDIDVRSAQRTETQTLPCPTKTSVWKESGCTRSLKAHEYKRYGRQMIMPEVGFSGILEPS